MSSVLGQSSVVSVEQWKPICFLLSIKAAEGVHLVWISASLSPVGTFLDSDRSMFDPSSNAVV